VLYGTVADVRTVYDRVVLHQFISDNREEIIVRCRGKVVTRSTSKSAQKDSDHGVPVFLDQLVDELRLGLSPSMAITKTATQHGHDLRRQGFTVSQVVHDYGDVCQSITEMAVEQNAPISTDDFRMLNRCLDDAIAGAVTEYGREPDQSIAQKAPSESEALGSLVHELRSSIQTATIALDMIKSGSVGIAGSTGTVLDRSLAGAHGLINRLLVEVSAPPARPQKPDRNVKTRRRPS
jgi:hypothetical protein